ncbi:hypothetical protein HYC85_028336 [Camellia sinensis]|uniref:Macrophage migration inhibitory factor n=1 Tax=Camellia sinensis TaxID=4442 RepID=A0A7J7FUZ4_CAMSI|nr:hypothetical protein HYC85_028336 [Camellia sinensis]
MPCLNLPTNVNLEGIDISSILKEATSAVADLIGKPDCSCDVPIAIGGIEDPAANGEVVSIGGLNPDVNKKLSAAITTILEAKLSKLSVPPTRFFLKFYDTLGSNFGWNGTIL